MAEQELKACGSCGLPTTEEDSYRSGPNGEREHFTDTVSGCEVRRYQAMISSLTARLSSAEAEVDRLRKRNGELVLHLREALDTPEEELRCGILLHHEWLTIEEEEMARQQEAAARRQQGGTDVS